MNGGWGGYRRGASIWNLWVGAGGKDRIEAFRAKADRKRREKRGTINLLGQEVKQTKKEKREGDGKGRPIAQSYRSSRNARKVFRKRCDKHVRLGIDEHHKPGLHGERRRERKRTRE